MNINIENIQLLGRKVGMTRLFKPDGQSVPVSVLEIKPNHVTQVKTTEIDGYFAVQLVTGSKKQSRVNKSMAGHFSKANVHPGDQIGESRLDEETDVTIGHEFKIEDIFKEGQIVDVVGTSKGKGFAGTVKRHNFRTQDATHGNSRSHRVPGSIGQNQTPGRVFKGKKMAGHMGNERCTVQSLEIVKLDTHRHLVMVKGSVPGFSGRQIILKSSVKHKTRGK
jgi:large subunit ribosomal protein L3